MCKPLHLVGKIKSLHTPQPQPCISLQMLDWFSSLMNWLMTGIWLTVEQHWALFHVHQKTTHLVPFSKEQMGYQSPLGDWTQKLSSFKANFLVPVFCKQLLLVLFWELISWEGSESLLLQRPAKSCLLVWQWPSLLPNPLCLVFLSAQLDHPHCRELLHTSLTLAKRSQVGSFQSNSQGNQSIVDPPVSVLPVAVLIPTQLIPDSMPADVKCLLQKFSSMFRTGDVVPNPSHGVENHIHTGGHPPIFAKIWNCQGKFFLSNIWNPRVLSTSPWASPLHMVPRKDGSWWP